MHLEQKFWVGITTHGNAHLFHGLPHIYTDSIDDRLEQFENFSQFKEWAYQEKHIEYWDFNDLITFETLKVVDKKHGSIFKRL